MLGCNKLIIFVYEKSITTPTLYSKSMFAVETLVRKIKKKTKQNANKIKHKMFNNTHTHVAKHAIFYKIFNNNTK